MGTNYTITIWQGNVMLVKFIDATGAIQLEKVYTTFGAACTLFHTDAVNWTRDGKLPFYAHAK